MSWEIELERALVAAIEGDDALRALLGDGAVFARRPVKRAKYPQLTFSCREEIFTPLSGGGRVDVRLCIDIWCANAADSPAIREALENLLDERRRVKAGLDASPLTMAGWRCGAFRYVRSEEKPAGERSESAEITQRITEWDVRLYSE